MTADEYANSTAMTLVQCVVHTKSESVKYYFQLDDDRYAVVHVDISNKPFDYGEIYSRISSRPSGDPCGCCNGSGVRPQDT